MRCAYCGRSVEPDEKGSCPFCGAPLSERLDPESHLFDPELAKRLEEDKLAAYTFWRTRADVIKESKALILLIPLLAIIFGLLLGWLSQGGFL